MSLIFFDLETSSRLFMGQILNYSFIETDDSLNILDELSGKIRVSRLELPDPGAIITNRINLLMHNEDPHALSEPESMRLITEFISKKCSGPLKPRLLGYNSSKFDIPFLRTSLIRNGINPYFGGKIVYEDLLFVVRKLATLSQDFPLHLCRNPLDNSKLSLKLETVSSALNVSKNPQTHESRDDVLLTIDLARNLETNFGVSLQSFNAIETPPSGMLPRSAEVFYFVEPEYDLGLQRRSCSYPATLLDSNSRSSLWIDLRRYAQGAGRKSIRWINKGSSCMYLSPEIHLHNPEHAELAKTALDEFSKINLANFFRPTECDIEQHIYRLDFDAIAALNEAIWSGNTAALKALENKDASVIFLRYRLANYVYGSGFDTKLDSLLRDYSLYRYGGHALVLKGELEQTDVNPFHPRLSLFLHEIEERLTNTKDEKDIELLEALKGFYFKSDIFRVAGEALLGLGS
jgi:hypothetical protein